jgi:hypothetical protein
LPEGVQVEIRVYESTLDMPPDLQAELTAWQRASALELVERLAEEDSGHAQK